MVTGVPFPFLSRYDPAGTSEGSVDPLGLYLLSDQLATALVPGVRERMQRVRLLTAIAVGSLVTEDLAAMPGRSVGIPPYQAWEWLVVEAIVRSCGHDPNVWGIPGTAVTGQAIARHGYVDARSYLRAPRFAGFHGVYKALAVHLEIVDDALRLREGAGEGLLQAWAADLGLGRFGPGHPLCGKWRGLVQACLTVRSTRTCSAGAADWQELAECLLPHRAGPHERGLLRSLLLAARGNGASGALPPLWALLKDESGGEINERPLHRELAAAAPEWAPLLAGIAAYERFARVLVDAFDTVRYHATHASDGLLTLGTLQRDPGLTRLAGEVAPAYAEALRALEPLTKDGLFAQRFEEGFGARVGPLDLALRLCDHHERIQRQKSREGKLPWFDRIGADRIATRPDYRLDELPAAMDSYVHAYRARPISRFQRDLT